jgi:calmodulin
MSTRRSNYLSSRSSTLRLSTQNFNKTSSSRFEDIQETKMPKIYEPQKEIRDIFKLFDKDGNGKMSTAEIRSLLFSLGREASEEEIQKMLEECDKDKSGTIELNEFLTYMEPIYKIPSDKIEDIVSAFKFFDLDGNGNINMEEFKNILSKYGGEFSLDEIESIFRQLDLNRDGKLDYAEFVDMWKYQ